MTSAHSIGLTARLTAAFEQGAPGEQGPLGPAGPAGPPWAELAGSLFALQHRTWASIAGVQRSDDN